MVYPCGKFELVLSSSCVTYSNQVGLVYGPDKAFLPRTEVDGKEHKQGEYIVICDDDILSVETKHGKILLEKWIKNSV